MKLTCLLFLCIAYPVASHAQIVTIPYKDDIKVPVITLDINGKDYHE